VKSADSADEKSAMTAKSALLPGMVDLQRELLAEMRALRQELAELRSRVSGPVAGSLDGIDRGDLAALLPTVFEVLGDSAFATRDLFKPVDIHATAANAMRSVLSRVGRTSQEIGRLLGRAAGAGAVLAGYRVVSLGICTHTKVTRWRIKRG
jgi:hypothetical protein